MKTRGLLGFVGASFLLFAVGSVLTMSAYAGTGSAPPPPPPPPPTTSNPPPPQSTTPPPVTTTPTTTTTPTQTGSGASNSGTKVRVHHKVMQHAQQREFPWMQHAVSRGDMGGCTRDQARRMRPGDRMQCPGQVRGIVHAGGTPGRHLVERRGKPVQSRAAAKRGQHVVLPKKCEKPQMLDRLGFPVGQSHLSRDGDQAVEGLGTRARRDGKSDRSPGTRTFTQ